MAKKSIKILSEEMYKQAGEEIDRKLSHMQKIIFDSVLKKKRIKMSVEFVEEENIKDSVEDLVRAKIAIQNKLITGPIDPIFIHYKTIIRALDELISFREALKELKN